MSTITKEGLSILKQAESLSLKAYYDVNGWAIGYGMHNYSNGTPVQQSDIITTSYAESEFLKVVVSFGKQVAKSLTSKVSDSQFTALTLYAYNRGIGAFRSSKLLKMVNNNPNDTAIPAQFIKEWGTNTKYKTVLIKRRTKEAALYRKGSTVDTLLVLKIFVSVSIAYWIYIKFIKA